MYFNPFLIQQLVEERVNDALRQAERARLIRAATRPRKRQKRHSPVALSLGSLLSLVIRPQS